jgi:hypothetical protein
MTACSGGEDSSPAQPFGEPREREKREMRWAAHQEERRHMAVVCSPLPWASFI